MRGYTVLDDSERMGLRRLRDCGCISEVITGKSTLRYRRLVKNGLAKGRVDGERFVFTVTERGRNFSLKQFLPVFRGAM